MAQVVDKTIERKKPDEFLKLPASPIFRPKSRAKAANKSLLMTRSQIKTPPTGMRMSLHPKTFGKLCPIVRDEVPVPTSKLSKLEQEATAKAEKEFEDQLKKIEAADKAKKREQLLDYKRLAIALEKKQTDRVYAMTWLGKTVRARYEGPFAVPERPEDIDLLESEKKGFGTPRSAAAMFLLALCYRNVNPKKANALLLKVLHADCLQHSNPDTKSKKAPDMVRKHTFKVLHSFSKNCIDSYVVGTTPENNYTFDPTCVKFEVDNLSTTKVFKNENGTIATVYMVTTGSPPYHPRSRAVEVKNSNGKWYVRKFIKLTAAVVPGIVPEVEVSDPRIDNYIVPEAVGGGLQKVDLQATLRKKNKKDVLRTRSMIAEEELAILDAKEHDDSQQRARDATLKFAESLVARDLLERIENESPEVQRQFVTTEGNIVAIDDSHVDNLKTIAAKPKKKVKAEEAVQGFEPRQQGLLPKASTPNEPSTPNVRVSTAE